MSKQWYKSQTIISAIATYLAVILPIGYELISDERMPNEEEITVALAGAYTLEKTINGRLKAKESIGKDSKVSKVEVKPAVESEVSIPNFAEIESLPGPDNYDDKAGVVEEVDSKEEDYLQIDLSSLQGNYKLVAKQPTKLKTSWKDTAELDTSEWLDIKAGQELKVVSWRFCNPKNSHLVVGINEYPGLLFFVFAPHWQLFNDLGKEVNLEEAVPEAKKVISKPVISKNRGKSFKLPGFESTFYMNDFIAGTHFTHKEFWRNGERLPYKKSQVENAIILAKLLDELRRRLGDTPMILTSAYRPGPGSPQGDINGSVGGAWNSEHLFENSAAVDFYCPNKSIHQIGPIVEQFCREKGLSFGDTRGTTKGFYHIGFRNGWDKVFRHWKY